MRRFLTWAIWLPITIVVVGFAVANRQWVNVSFDPFNAATPYAAIAMPLWALLFCGLFIGALAGWLICWLGQSKWRKSAKEARSQLRRTASELNALKQAPAGVPAVTEPRDMPL